MYDIEPFNENKRSIMTTIFFTFIALNVFGLILLLIQAKKDMKGKSIFCALIESLLD